jgi:hypothetical protein
MADQSLYRSQWKSIAPRQEIAPEFCLGDVDSGWANEAGSLQIRLPHIAGSQGKWVRALDGIAAGARYRLTARFRAEGIADIRRSLFARVLWQGAGGTPLSHDRQEYFVVSGRDAEGWSTITGVRTAPADAHEAELQLVAAWAPGGLLKKPVFCRSFCPQRTVTPLSKFLIRGADAGR